MAVSLFTVGVIFLALVPIFLAIVSIVFWRLLSLCRTSLKHTYKRNAICMAIIFVFLLYPIIVNKTLEMVNCIKVEDEFRL